MIRVISSFADGPVNFHSTGPAEDQIQKLISSTDCCKLTYTDPFLIKKEKSYNRDHIHTWHIKIGGRGTFCMKNR